MIYSLQKNAPVKGQKRRNNCPTSGKTTEQEVNEREMLMIESISAAAYCPECEEALMPSKVVAPSTVSDPDCDEADPLFTEEELEMFANME